MKAEETLRHKTYLALGDSYTIGTAIKSQDAFPYQLKDSLLKQNYDVEVKIVAQNGWRTDDLQRGIKRTTLDEKYDLISLLIGVNNQYQQLPIEDYTKDFNNLLDSAIQYAGGKKANVFVVSIPNYGVTPFGAEKKEQTTEQLKVFNQIAEAICNERNISYFNVTPISLEAEHREDYRAKDNLHPSAIQYAAWVSSFLDEVLKKLNSDG
ncbi:MAG: SGNH/GDSL hydrolase family protein [Bacteroidia bacterium]|nr:SGNH/GDSL hydrolase family protein [Bacteroidia bacterium]